MPELHPDDRPPEPGLVPTVDEAAIAAALGPNSPENPVAVGAWLMELLHVDGGPHVQYLEQLIITPESRADWGDFTEAAALLQDCSITNQPSPSDDPNVVYVKYVTDDGNTYQVKAEDGMVLMARAIATLVRRPELGGWRVHHLGDYVRPDEVPR